MLQYKKTVMQKTAQDFAVLHGTGTVQVLDTNRKLSLSGEDYLVVDILVMQNGMPAGAVVRARFFTQDIYLGKAEQVLGEASVNTTATSKLTSELMARAEYAVIELVLPQHAANDYKVTALATALQATEAAVLTGANVVNDAAFVIGVENAADVIRVTGQLKDIFGAAIAERKPVYYALCSDALGDVVAAADSVAVHAGSLCAIKEELTAKASGLATTNATGQLDIDILYAGGAHTRYLLLECDGKRVVSPAIVWA